MDRWWWKGNCVNSDEIILELNIFKNAGIGGVEIKMTSLVNYFRSLKDNLTAQHWTRNYKTPFSFRMQ